MAEDTWKNYREKKHSKPLPLKGIRVLEVCTFVLGPSGPGILSRLGAEVIKCEMPPLGDTLRSLLNPGEQLQRKQCLPNGYRSTCKSRRQPAVHWSGIR